MDHQPDRTDSDHAPGGDPGGTPRDASLWELVSVLLSAPEVEHFLDQLADIAARTAGDAETSHGRPETRVSCGITLRRDSRPLTVASSDAVAMAVDEEQYANGDGPCLEALRTGRVVSAPDMAAEERWQPYPSLAITHGIASSLSLPLVVDGVSIGAMNLYGRVPHAFDGREVVARTEALAAQASATLAVVLRHARQSDLTASLQATLASRSVIDQAIGILMGQQRCTASEAFTLLRSASQHRNRRLRDVAADVITTTSGRPPEPAPFDDPA